VAALRRDRRRALLLLLRGITARGRGLLRIGVLGPRRLRISTGARDLRRISGPRRAGLRRRAIFGFRGHIADEVSGAASRDGQWLAHYLYQRRGQQNGKNGQE
jgi:hypothetical protein